MRRSRAVGEVVASSAAPPYPQRKGFGRRVVSVLVAIVVVGMTMLWTGAVIGQDADRSDTDALWVWGAVVVLAVAGFLLVTVHELGHLVAAKALRLRVTGMKVSPLHFWSRSTVPGSSGHVKVDVRGDETRLPLRMVVFALAGPAAVLVVAVVTLTIVEDRSAPLWLRAVSVGVTVAAVSDALGSLVPRRIRDDVATDGMKALGWAFRPAAQRARIGDRLDLARLRLTAASTQLSAGHQREYFLTAVDDPRPELAVAAMAEVLRKRPRYDDGWQDVDVVARFAARDDISPAVRASVSGTYALSLSLAYLSTLRADEETDTHSPQMQQIERLAQLARAADRESLAGRTAEAFVLVLQDRPTEARTALIDIDPTASPAVQARAYAVRGIAEVELGDLSQAVSLGLVARRLAPDETLLQVLEAKVSQKSR